MTEPGWAIFLDFDGTLVDIAPRPEAVVVEPGLPALLDLLRAACGGALAIVTGRSIEAIDAFLPGLGLDTCGLHGMERRLAGRIERVHVDGLDAFRAAVAPLIGPLQGIPGVVIEDKGESVAFHWRGAPTAEPLLREAATRLARSIDGFRVQEGKAIVEVVPAVSGKGAAIAALLEHPPYRGRRPLFAGDDVTDENGFVAVDDLGGLTIKIGMGETAASRRVASPAAFRSLLASGQSLFTHLAALDAASSTYNIRR